MKITVLQSNQGNDIPLPWPCSVGYRQITGPANAQDRRLHKGMSSRMKSQGTLSATENEEFNLNER